VVAEAIDNLYIDDIAASIAGDNVVLIISYGNKEAILISKSLDSYLI
jgi:arginine repressor